MSEEAAELTAEQLLEAAKAGVEVKIPESKEEEEEKPKEEEHKIYNCPRCTYRLLNADGTATERIKPEEAEVQEYVRRIMSGQRFEKTYKINSMFSITFTTLSSGQAKQVTRVLRQLSMDDREQQTLAELAYSIKMMCAVKKIDAPGNVREFTFPGEGDTIEFMQEEYKKRFENEDEWMTVTLVRAFSEFERLLNMLAEASFSANFWKGAGLE
jgi:transposase-like protein